MTVKDTIPLPNLTFIQLFPRSLGNQYLKLNPILHWLYEIGYYTRGCTLYPIQYNPAIVDITIAENSDIEDKFWPQEALYKTSEPSI